ncbi:chaplin [Streptomyces sp. 8N616]|uniref:chaplin n=1 Tax=Streptomyces sp. 8N616 TaxID=3457414 RepID=UPI003FD5ADB3
MRRVARNGLVTAVATGGVLAAAAGYAHADAGAEGTAARSPGVVSGNTVQAPVHVPVNVCGNTVNAVGLLSPAAGNRCVNDSRGHGGDYGEGSHSSAPAGATAHARGRGSPGIASGNTVQLPVDVPVNVTGNSVNVGGIGNAAVGNSSSNGSGDRPHKPRTPQPPTADKPVPPRTAGVHAIAPTETETLAQTGAGVPGYVVPAGAGLLLGGALLYRRFRPAQH